MEHAHAVFNTSNILTMPIVPKININSKMMNKTSQNVKFQHFNCFFLVIFFMSALSTATTTTDERDQSIFGKKN